MQIDGDAASSFIDVSRVTGHFGGHLSVTDPAGQSTPAAPSCPDVVATSRRDDETASYNFPRHRNASWQIHTARYDSTRRSSCVMSDGVNWLLGTKL